MNRRNKRRNNSTISQRGTQRGTHIGEQKEDTADTDVQYNCGSQSVPTERRVRFRSKSECGNEEPDSDSDKETTQRQLLGGGEETASLDSLCSDLQDPVCRVNSESSSSTETLKESLRFVEDNVFSVCL